MEILTTTVKNLISSLSISIFKPYSGDSLTQKKNITSLKDLHLVNVLESACVSFVVQKRGIDREGWGRRKDGATERENESD